MPNEISQPFQDGKQRSTDDRELVAGVLGPDAAVEMGQLVGGQAEPTLLSTGLDLSKDEQTLINEAEESKAEERRQEYYAWAEDFGKNEEWVNETFVFEQDGKVRGGESLYLGSIGITELPLGLYIEDGILYLHSNLITEIANIPDSVTNLYLHHNQITEIANIPELVTLLSLGYNQIDKIINIPESVTYLDLCNNKITKIENIPESVTKLDLSGNPIESLEPLVGKKLEHLTIRDIESTTIPEGIEVGKIYLSSSQTELIADCELKGYNVGIS